MALIFLPFYFPDGHAYPKWLSPILPAIMVLALFWGGSDILASTTVDYLGQIANPLFVTGAQAFSQYLGAAFVVLVLFLIVGIFASPLLRYQRANFVQRKQIKWFAWWSMIVFTPYLVFYVAMVLAYPQRSAAPVLLQFLLSIFVGLIGFFPPIIIAFAILRQRLYDIDVNIRKTADPGL